MLRVPGFLNPLFRRWLDLSLRIKGLTVLVLPVIAVAMSAMLVSSLEHAKADADRHLKRGVEVRAQLQNMFVVLISAESEVRNYGLNGREDGIYPFSLTRAAIDPLFKKVGELMAGDREQEQRLEKLRLLVQSRFEGLKSLRDYYSSPETRSKPASEEQRAAAKISPDVILAVNELGTAESKRFQDEMKGEADRQAKLHFWIYVTEFAGLLSGVLGVVLLTGSIKRRVVRLESNAFCLAEGLPSEELVTRQDELGRLASAIERAGAVIASRSEELKLALEGGGVIIWELEPGTGRIRYHAGSEAFQSDAIPAELLPGTASEWIAIVHPEDRDRIEQALHRIAAESGSFQIEYRVQMRGGAIRWMTVTAQSYGSEVQDRRLLGVLADITVRKATLEEVERQAQELSASRAALENQTRILQSILDSMGDGVVVADSSGKFLVFNPAARQMMGARSFTGDSDQWARLYGLFLPDMVTLYPSDRLPFVRSIRGESVDAEEIFVAGRRCRRNLAIGGGAPAAG